MEINADIGMLLPDFRAGEKTFQLIYQLIGRSGRHKNNSKAIIQSYNVKDQYINLACKNELNKFEVLIEENRSSYEEILDKTTRSIEKFIENSQTDQKKNVQ